MLKQNCEEICSGCNGEGNILDITPIPCGPCEGRGYYVQIVEIVTQKIPCVTCDGKSWLEGEFIQCATCAGLGVVDNANPGIKECSGCEGLGEVNGFVCYKCRGSGIIYSVESEDGLNESPCPTCSGEGSVSEQIACGKCDGKGAVEVSSEHDVTPESN